MTKKTQGRWLRVPVTGAKYEYVMDDRELVQALPEGYIGPRLANVPVYEPTLIETQPNRQITVEWPDDVPDVALVARSVVMDMAEQINELRRLLPEFSLLRELARECWSWDTDDQPLPGQIPEFLERLCLEFGLFPVPTDYPS